MKRKSYFSGSRIKVRILPVELCMVWIGLPHNLHNTNHAGRLGVGVVEEGQLSRPHLAHKIPGLVVAHTVPARGRAGHRLQVLKTKLHFDALLNATVWLGLHEPVSEGRDSRGVLFGLDISHSGLGKFSFPTTS